MRRLGVGVSLDDFGTGFSSLNYLHRLPVTELKIDRSFVAEIDDNSENAALTQAIVVMGHSLGISVVAEGVEQALHLRILREIGCDIAQGFYLGRPMAKERLVQLCSSPGDRATT